MPLLRLQTVEAPTADAPDTAAPAQPAASAPSEIHASGTAIAIGYVAVIAGIAGGWGLYELIEPNEFVPAAGTSAFAIIFVFAAAIERFVEPFGYLAERGEVEAKDGAEKRSGTKSDALENRNKALAEALSTTDKDVESAKLKQAAEWHRLLEQIRQNKSVIVWGVATLLAALASGAFGVFLLQVLGFDVHPAVDVAVTGLAIGSGTKPLHELVKSLQTAKEDKKDPDEVSGKS
jgi:hypothetical protein